MSNPFEDSFCEHSIDQFNSSMPVCFAQLNNTQPVRHIHESELSSPKTIIDIDRLTERFSYAEVSESELKSSLKQVQQMLKQLKSYSECLQQRNLDIVLELQRQKMKNKQLLNTLHFIKNCEEQEKENLEDKINSYHSANNKYSVQKNRNEILQHQIKTIKLENTYLKELILIANQNYEQLQHQNQELITSCTNIETQHNQREVEMVRKSQEIKAMFTNFVIQKNQLELVNRSVLAQKDRGSVNAGNMANGNATLSFNSNKSMRKQHVQDAYRQLFMKTLKNRKENKM